MWIELKDGFLINLNLVLTIAAARKTVYFILDYNESEEYRERYDTEEQAQARYEEIKALVLQTKQRELVTKHLKRMEEYGDEIDSVMLKVGGSE